MCVCVFLKMKLNQTYLPYFLEMGAIPETHMLFVLALGLKICLMFIILILDRYQVNLVIEF